MRCMAAGSEDTSVDHDQYLYLSLERCREVLVASIHSNTPLRSCNMDLSHDSSLQEMVWRGGRHHSRLSLSLSSTVEHLPKDLTKYLCFTLEYS